jgi:hypothetical protein
MLMGAAATWLLRTLPEAVRSRDVTRALGAVFASYSAILIGFGAAYFPAINYEQDLRPVTSALRNDLHGRQLVLLAPDETTEAVVDMKGIPSRTIDWSAGQPKNTSASIHDNECVLAMSKLTIGPLYDLMRRYGIKSQNPRDSANIGSFAAAFGLQVERDYIVPDGRHYVLLGRQNSGVRSQ